MSTATIERPAGTHTTEVNDTVRVIGEPGLWIVETVYPDRYTITGTQAHGHRSYTASTRTVAAERVVLARKGNRTQDVEDAIEAEWLALRAYRNGSGTLAAYKAAQAATVAVRDRR